MQNSAKARTWEEAIIRVLTEANRPLHYREISQKIIARGLYTTSGQTPERTVSSVLSESIRNEGARSPFAKTAPGEYTLMATGVLRQTEVTHVLPDTDLTPMIGAENPIPVSSPILQNLGIRWNAALIDWSRPKLLGRLKYAKTGVNEIVDFSDQVGVYVLYDGNAPIYVGRTIDQPIRMRLKAHMKPRSRLYGKWDGFSWFGIKSVTPDGGLTFAPRMASPDSIITLMESLLIETMQPYGNNRRGDHFLGREFDQVRQISAFLAGRRA